LEGKLELVLVIVQHSSTLPQYYRKVKMSCT
jgi:hypothetical protein